MGPQPYTNYLKSAVAKIYGDEDDFILLGLTGRTGSGCSTAAEILQSEKSKVKHSLFDGNAPNTNAQRKERIISRHFSATWTPFLLIQVRSIITTFLLDEDANCASEEFSHLLLKQELKAKFSTLLEELQEPYKALLTSSNTTNPTTYYTQTLPQKCEALKSLLGESVFVKLYQEVGRNLRLSGNPYKREMIEGKFFTIAERINAVVKQVHRFQQKQNPESVFA